MADKILVVNSDISYGKVVKGFGEIVYDSNVFMSNPKDFKLILFTGGSDVSPQLYGDSSPKGMCRSNIKRDVQEIQVFKLAKKHGVIMTGICRGLQFINVMNGGKLMHHIDGHSGVYRHDIRTNKDEILSVNSLHHQMVLPPENSIIMAWASPSRSREYYGKNDELLKGVVGMIETEAVLYPSTKSFGVQYHPEMMESLTDGYVWYKSLVLSALDNYWEDFVSEAGNNVMSRQERVGGTGRCFYQN